MVPKTPQTPPPKSAAPLVLAAAVRPLGDAAVLREAIAADQRLDIDGEAPAARSAGVRVICGAKETGARGV